MLPLVATLSIFKAMQDTKSVVSKNKKQVTKAGNYLSKRLAMLAALVDKTMPTMATWSNAILCSKGYRHWRPRTLLFDIAKGLTH